MINAFSIYGILTALACRSRAAFPAIRRRPRREDVANIGVLSEMSKDFEKNLYKNKFFLTFPHLLISFFATNIE
ncbi:MAG: hypothetical protein IJV33_06945 [Bacteroidaceae bacterium]|nr:hypothetical protein [Bacteroidaceae bacterium]